MPQCLEPALAAAQPCLPCPLLAHRTAALWSSLFARSLPFFLPPAPLQPHLAHLFFSRLLLSLPLFYFYLFASILLHPSYTHCSSVSRAFSLASSPHI